MKQKFVDILDECIELSLDEGRGRPKKADATSIEAEFKAAKKDEKAINKLIMKYGEHDAEDIAGFKKEVKALKAKSKINKSDEKKITDLENKINVFNVIKKYMKYQTEFSAEEFAGRDGDAEHSIVASRKK